MKLAKLILSTTALAVLTSSLTGQSTFVFENSSTTIGAGLSGQSSGSFTVGGIEITATAMPGQTFNATGSGFGINHTNSGDDTDGFDFGNTTGEVAEFFTLEFDQAVNLVSFDVSSWGASDEAVLTDGATTVATISSTGVTSLSNYQLGASSILTVSTTAGTYSNGWSFDSITVTAVPEPGSFALLAGFCGLVFVMLKRRGS